MLVEIFDFLPLPDLYPASMVCKRWFEIIRTSRISRKAVAHLTLHTYEMIILGQEPKVCTKKYVETTIAGYDLPVKWQITEQILKELYEPYLKNVQTLSLKSIKISASLVQLLTAIASLKHLRELYVSYIDLTDMQQSTVVDWPASTLDLKLDILEYNAAYYDMNYSLVKLENADLLLALLKSVRWIKSLRISMDWYWLVKYNKKQKEAVLKICEDRCDTIKLDKLTILQASANLVTQYIKQVDLPRLACRELAIDQGAGTGPREFYPVELNHMQGLQSLNIIRSFCESKELVLIADYIPNLQELHICYYLGNEPTCLDLLVKLKYLKKLVLDQWGGDQYTKLRLPMNPLLELERLEYLSLCGQPCILVLDEATLSQGNCLANLKTFAMEVEGEGRMEMETIETLKFMFSRTLCLEKLSFEEV
jgi:F-box-like